MKDILKYFKTGQLTDDEYVEHFRKSARFSQNVKKIRWYFICIGIVVTVIGVCKLALFIKLMNVIPDAAKSNAYLMGLVAGITIGMVIVSSIYVGIYARAHDEYPQFC